VRSSSRHPRLGVDGLSHHLLPPPVQSTRSQLKLIGLTGGAGSGKSTVASMFRDLGAAIVDADEATHAVYAPGAEGFDAVVREFGSDFVRDGEIDRAKLGELVFHDKDALRRLNAIVHPLVREWMAERTVEAVNGGAEVVIQDVPLLFESGLEGLFSDVVLVYASEAVQLRRLIERGVEESRARAIIASQMPIEDKRSRTRLVVDNSGAREETRRQVEAVWTKVRSL
jgi:dephospho-CoA kinase